MLQQRAYYCSLKLIPLCLDSIPSSKEDYTVSYPFLFLYVQTFFLLIRPFLSSFKYIQVIPIFLKGHSIPHPPSNCHCIISFPCGHTFSTYDLYMLCSCYGCLLNIHLPCFLQKLILLRMIMSQTKELHFPAALITRSNRMTQFWPMISKLKSAEDLQKMFVFLVLGTRPFPLMFVSSVSLKHWLES